MSSRIFEEKPFRTISFWRRNLFSKKRKLFDMGRFLFQKGSSNFLQNLKGLILYQTETCIQWKHSYDVRDYLDNKQNRVLYCMFLPRDQYQLDFVRWWFSGTDRLLNIGIYGLAYNYSFIRNINLGPLWKPVTYSYWIVKQELLRSHKANGYKRCPSFYESEQGFMNWPVELIWLRFVITEEIFLFVVSYWICLCLGFHQHLPFLAKYSCP